MASASVGTSPLSGFEFEFPQATDAAGDADEAFWTMVGSAATASVGFMSSPASHSLGSSWAVLGNGRLPELQPSPVALSPQGEVHPPSPLSGPLFADQSGSAAISAGFGGADASFFMQDLAQAGLDFAAAGALAFGEQFDADISTPFNPFSTSTVDGQQALESLAGFENPQPLQSGVNVPPWEPLNLRAATTNNNNNNNRSNNTNTIDSNALPLGPPLGEPSPIFILEDPGFISRSPSHEHSPWAVSASVSPSSSASPRSPAQIKRESGLPAPSRSPTTAAAPPKTGATPVPIRKANNSNRVQKRKTTSTSTVAVPLPPTASPTATTTTSSSSSSSTANHFLIVTPSSITRHADKPNPYECFEALRPSQRGRKGPLATDTKQSALQVRRMGACFSCHARKVRCDKERPCRSCVRLAQQLPQVVCWQFSDFTPTLFPPFIRAHLRRDEVARFVQANVESFAAELPCTVRLVSGVGFSAVLELHANFFTARSASAEALQHWHVQAGGGGRNATTVDLLLRGAAPIGLDASAVSAVGAAGAAGEDAQRAELKRRLRDYVQAIVDEPRFAELVTPPPPQHTELPRRVLRIVHAYAYATASSGSGSGSGSGSPMLRRALSIYAMHFVMTRHLCLEPRNAADLQAATGLVLPAGAGAQTWVTPRVLNRQVKAVLDELLCREMVVLFEGFAKSLKPKLRREWAPCLASFLVLCLFMESVEAAADLFVMSDNEISLRHRRAPAWKRSFVLDVNAQIENMPFKQFAFQFHQIYQTHSRDAAARSFNPLLDDACFELGELDRDAADMVRQLRRFINQDWAELDYLTADPILPNIEHHPFPRNVAENYTGRLVAKFLLSFTDEKYILGKT